MTTPERLRRRQRIESALVIIVILLTCLSTWYTLQRSNNTQDCLEDTVQDLTNALQTRAASTNALADLTDERVDLLSDLLNNVATLVVSPPPDPDKQGQEFVRLLSQYQTDTARLDKEQARLTALRAKTPYPDYPNGKCD